jgi:hypothetical protein
MTCRVCRIGRVFSKNASRAQVNGEIGHHVSHATKVGMGGGSKVLTAPLATPPPTAESFGAICPTIFFLRRQT